MRETPLRETLLRRSRIEQVEERVMSTVQPGSVLPGEQLIQHEVQSLDQAAQAAALGGVVQTLASNSYGFTGAGQTVVVIDSGIAYDHPALGGGFGAGHRVVGGWDFAENDANPYDDAPGGAHGTHVAGIIGSTDRTSPGVAPGVDLVALRVFDDQGNGDFDQVDQALRWVHTHITAFHNPITTVNLSIGTDWNSTTVPSWSTLENDFAQLKADGIFISVAAGNAFTTYNTAGLSYPAASPYVVPVASVDGDGSLSYFSQRQDRVIAAPGRNIRSTVPDYVGNMNGITDDFATFSGTSMAAPYVAGASVILRQALQSVGTTNITEDTLYNLMRSTADMVFDSATNHSYYRLNLDRALSTVVSTDDYGSTPATAYSLGSTSHVTLSGHIERSSDRDYFTFVAGQTGTATVTATPAGSLRTSWELVGGGQASGGAISFSVVAGQTYTVGLSATQGTGAYGVDLTITPAVSDLGAIGFTSLANQNTAIGDHWYNFTAGRTGTLSAEALFNQTGGGVSIELYDSAHQLVASSSNTSGLERLDVAVHAGDAFTLCVRGSNSQVGVRLTNLVSQTGSAVIIAGTSGNDTFEFTAGSSLLCKVNGVSYSFAAGSSISFDGAAGNDSATLTGSSGVDAAVFRPGSLTLSGAGYSVDLSGIETINVTAGAGNDTATFYDSSGNDVFASTSGYAYLTGGGFANYAFGFEQVTARSTAGGADTAYFYDTPGDNVFASAANYAYLSGTGFANNAIGFAVNYGISSAGGNDAAYFYDSKGSDVYAAAPRYAYMSGPGFANYSIGFGINFGLSMNGGIDAAYLYDSAGDDVFISAGSMTALYGGGFYNRADGFKQSSGVAIYGGHDQAIIKDYGGASLVAQGNTARLAAGDSWVQAVAFELVNAVTLGTSKKSVSATDFVLQQDGNWIN